MIALGISIAILPSAKIYYRNVPNKDTLKEWIYCVANLRACPMTEKSDQIPR